MKGLRSRGEGEATSHLGTLHVTPRTTTILDQVASARTSAAPSASDGDLLDTADEQIKHKGTRAAQTGGRIVKNATETVGKSVIRESRAVGSRLIPPARTAGEAIGEVKQVGKSGAMGTRPVKGGLIAAARRHAARKMATKTSSTATRRGMRTAGTGMRGLRRTAQAVSSVGRLVAVAISALSSTPGIIVGAVAVAAVSAIIAVLSIIPGIGQQASEQTAGAAIPAQYLDAVMTAGSVCPEITGSLIAAQVAAESGWDPTVTSYQGAQGISQFLPSTWASVGVDGDADGVADIWNPIDAIITQGHYMCGLAGQVKQAMASGAISGDLLSLTLASYNAGFGNVIAYAGIPPFKETQEYVSSILAAAAGQMAGDGGVSANLAEAVEWAKSVAADDSNAYVWGGNGPQDGGYDCSGLAKAVYQRLGIALPHSAAAQQQLGASVDRPDLKVGDLIFWGSPAYHVAIYAGGGWMVSADSESAGINYEPIYGSPSSYRRMQ